METYRCAMAQTVLYWTAKVESAPRRANPHTTLEARNMHAAKAEPLMLDAVAEPDDNVEVRIDEHTLSGLALYVDVNGTTVCRIGWIKQEIEVLRS